MDKDINKFIRHTITNLQGALMQDEDQLTLAVLVNLEGVIDSYIEALEDILDNPPKTDTLGKRKENSVIHCSP
jgi:hypothetical protein